MKTRAVSLDLADLAGSAMIIGAFAAGLVLSSTNQFDTVVERIEPVADIFTPIFFVAVGAPVNVRLFIPGTQDFDLGVLAVGLILTVIAIIAHFLVWSWRPWFPGPEGYAAVSGTVDAVAAFATTLIG